MKNFAVFAVAFLALIVIFGWSVGSFFHWLYWNMMIVASKMVFGVLFFIPVAILLVLVFLLIRKSKKA